MITLLIALVALFVLLFGGKAFTRANPARMARFIQQGSGVAAVGAAGLLFLRGRIDVALAVGGFGLYLLGFSGSPHWMGVFQRTRKAAGRTSQVRSASLEMQLDHDSGAMSGRILAGPFAGRTLAELTREQCETLLSEMRGQDPEGARLLEAYLDRRFAGWGGAAQDNANPGGRGGSREMSEDEAYQVLGLSPGASREEVARAHRALMKKLHPDHGGTTSLAARVNEAKDVLLRRHR